MSASSDFNEEQLLPPGGGAAAGLAAAERPSELRRSRLRDTSPTQCAPPGSLFCVSEAQSWPPCMEYLPTPTGVSCISCEVPMARQHLLVAHCRASPTLSEEAQHAMRLPPVAVSRRRRTGVVLPEQLPADAGGGAGSSSVSEESDATPGAPPPKKRRSGVCG